MKFYVIPWKGTPPVDKPPYCVLTADNWDDFSYQTYFHLKIYIKGTKAGDIIAEDLGGVKILHSDFKITSLPSVFEALDKKLCSLGQEPLFYERISKLPPKIKKTLLISIRDVVYSKEIRNAFEGHDGFKTSLLRFTPAIKALEEGSAILQNSKQDRYFKFDFTFQLSTFSNPHIINFDFEHQDHLPFRINGLVGKNGVGKTQCMSRLANVLSNENVSQGEFIGDKPLFDKIIAISYSVFDNIAKPASSDKFSYKYCGLQDGEGILNKQRIKDNINKALEEIHSLKRNAKWVEIICELMDQQEYFERFLSDQNVLRIEDIFPGEMLSSGQTMIISIITDILANIRHESLILFDEPENHLHPNATSTILKVFYKILEDYNSFSIICTHSPLILAEIPRKYIRVMEKHSGRVDIRQLDIETFGGNINEIISTVFNVVEHQSMYKSKLSEISKNLNFDEVMSEFENRLSIGTQIFLKNKYAQGST